MIRFLIKGLLKDRSRSLIPLIVTSFGVMITVVLHSWLTGIMSESLELNANITTGHMKVMTKAYSEVMDLSPLNLSIIGADSLVKGLKKSYAGTDWVKRIRFGGLVDVPDEKGETKAQGPVVGWSLDLLTKGTKEIERFNLKKSLISGSLPKKTDEGLLTDVFAKRYNIGIGDTFLLFSNTFEGSMSFTNFTVAGTIRFGSEAIDRGALIIDIKAAEKSFNMEDSAPEILGFLEHQYDDEKVNLISEDFNSLYRNNDDEFRPYMIRMRDQNDMGSIIDYSQAIGTLMVAIFVGAMSVVLWNAGLLGGLRRYSEFGIRLAMGEEKIAIYKSIIYEAILIGLIGSITGTISGLGISYYLQEKGIDISNLMPNSSILMPQIARANITIAALYIGFIPGLVSTVLGAVISGIGIFKRKTSMLFKELEV